MERLLISLFFFLLALNIPASLYSNDDYPDHQELTARLKSLASSYPGYVSLESLTKTEGQRDVWMLSVGSGNLAEQPAIAVVGGTTGDHLLGTELALRIAEKLLENTLTGETDDLLNSHTFYIFPDMSPDAREQYFSSLRYERRGNSNSSYTDRYGMEIEHPYRDLNDDGMISLMRIKDPAGEWIEHPDDERIMVKAMKSHGEKGKYNIYSEGEDILKDERWNEAGVQFNRNFSFNYPVFTKGAGHHALSEPESRAIAQFLFEAKNVYAVISFGPANNLSEPVKYNERDASGRIITGILEGDASVNQMVSKIYNEMTGKVAGKGVPGSDGDFFQWAYFHYGRFSFSTPGWSVPDINTEGSGNNENTGRGDNPELNFLRWAGDMGMDNVFIPWEKVHHPQFPDKEIEVGGIIPFAMKNPPAEMIGEIAENHYNFIIEFAGLRPVIEIMNVRTEELGRGLYRITADIVNKGMLPTVTELGERVRWVQKSVVRLEPGNGQEVLSGNRIEVLGPVEGGKSETRSWLIRGRGNIGLSAGAENSGYGELIIKL